MFDPNCKGPVRRGRAGKRSGRAGQHASRGVWARIAVAACLLTQLSPGPAAVAQNPDAQANPAPQQAPQSTPIPPRVIEAQRFLAQRGWTPGHRMPARSAPPPLERCPNRGPEREQHPIDKHLAAARPHGRPNPELCLVTGRMAAIALDPSDTTGNRLYIGTTGGGVWVANNAGFSAVLHRLYSAHRRRRRSRRSRRRFHQHWRAHRAAGRDRRDSGRHGRPQRCARLLLRRRHPALH